MRQIFLALALAGSCGIVGSAMAQDSENPREFTFKKIAPPKAGAAKRITVQIDPEEQARILATPFLPPREGPPLPNRDPFDPVPEQPPVADLDPAVREFWLEMGTGLAEASAARIINATDFLQRTGSVPAPSLQALQQIAIRHGQAILSESIGTRVSPALALAVIMTESSGREEAVSGAGAQGLMQLIPATAERFGVDDPFDASENIEGGIAYLDWLLGEFEGDALLALAGYNAGENAVKKNFGVPNYPETRAYVPKVIAAWTVARGLCITPPELPSDGCVFSAMAMNN